MSYIGAGGKRKRLGHQVELPAGISYILYLSYLPGRYLPLCKGLGRPFAAFPACPAHEVTIDDNVVLCM